MKKILKLLIIISSFFIFNNVNAAYDNDFDFGYIIENYDNCKLMTSLKFGANSDEMLFILDACTDEGDKKFEKLSKKRKTTAFENIKDLLSNFG